MSDPNLDDLKDELETNSRKVREGIDRTIAEFKTLPPRWKQAIADKDLIEFGHISMNLIGEPLQHMWRLWMYLWIPKWLVIGAITYKAFS